VEDALYESVAMWRFAEVELLECLLALKHDRPDRLAASAVFATDSNSLHP
jgi:hypothetical protein